LLSAPICSVFVLQIAKIQNENTTFEQKLHFGLQKSRKNKTKTVTGAFRDIITSWHRKTYRYLTDRAG
jgi:hypothetical protein